MTYHEAYWAGVNHREDYGDRPEGPLSDMQAGESISELSAKYGINLSDDKTATMFEAGFYGEEIHSR